VKKKGGLFVGERISSDVLIGVQPLQVSSNINVGRRKTCKVAKRSS
jgi:hypothetical protein